MKNSKLLISGAHGVGYCNEHIGELRAYIKSLANLNDFDIVVCTYDMPANLEAEFEDAGVFVSHRERPAGLARDNWQSPIFWQDCRRSGIEFLKQSDYRFVVNTDARDTIFQEDIPEMDGLHLFAEGMRYKDSRWNWEDMKFFRPEFLGHCASLPVINGGTIIGSREEVIKFHQDVLDIETSTKSSTTQAIVNWMVHSGHTKATIHHPSKSRLCLTGEAVALGIVRPIQQDGKFVTPTGEPYKIVHQWDRIPSPKARITRVHQGDPSFPGAVCLNTIGVPDYVKQDLKPLNEMIKGFEPPDWWMMGRPVGIVIYPECVLRKDPPKCPYVIAETIDGAELSDWTRTGMCSERPPLAVWKVAAYEDRGQYNLHAEPWHMEHCRKAFGLPPKTGLPEDIPEHLLDRIVAPYCFGCHSGPQGLLKFLEGRNVALWDQGSRDIDVSFVGRTNYERVEMPVDANLLMRHRQTCCVAINALKEKHSVLVHEGRLPAEEYYKILLRSKIAVSPYGVGECAYRDWEAIFAGCVLVKPPIEHVEDFPMHIGCSANFEDLSTVVNGILWQLRDGDDLIGKMQVARTNAIHQCSEEHRLEVMLKSLEPMFQSAMAL